MCVFREREEALFPDFCATDVAPRVTDSLALVVL